MPHSHRHHHHVARNIFDDVGQWLNKPFADTLKDNGKKQRDESAGGDQSTVIHTVYKTLEPTFEGPVGGYSTLNTDPAPEPTQAKAPSQAPSPTKIEANPTTSPKVREDSSVIPSVIRKPTTSSELETILAKATGNPSLSQTGDVGDQLFTSTPTLNVVPTTTQTSASTVAKDSGDGTSAGAKAGIAFGVLGGVFIVGLVAFLLFTRRRRQAAAAREETDDEKYHPSDNPTETITARSEPHAPRISLRPVTQLLPNWNFDKRASKGAAAALTTAAAMNADGQDSTMKDRPATSQSTHPANPFGSQAERIPEPTIQEYSAVPASDPFTANGPAIAAGAATDAAAGALTRKASIRKDGQRNLDFTVPAALGPVPPSPAGTEFSMTSVSPGAPVPQSNGAAAIAAAGGPANSNVHRVQLDFKPSMDDEMEMRAGELVRLLHEYDDGWALCLRLDRSQQGVVPRTCLSTRPVKPRSPQGGPRPGPPVNPSGQFPRGPGQRPMTPQGRPMTPQGRAMTSQGMPPQGRPRMGPGGPGGPGPRPMSPSGRPQSHGPRYNGPPPGSPGSRSQSPMGANRHAQGPPGAGPAMQTQSPPRGPPNGPQTGAVGRKPVPGQAY